MKQLLLFLVLAILLISCSNHVQAPYEPNTPAEPNAPTVNESLCYLPIAEELGEIGNVYHASTSRFIDGEVILNYWPENPDNKELVFVAELVEYNSFDQDVVNYIQEKHPKNNALLHQHYDVTYKEGKTYVEYASYVDKKTGEVLVIEIRIANGSDILSYDGSWYALSCRFSNDMSVDIDLKSETPFRINPQVVDLSKVPDARVVYDCNTGEVKYEDEPSVSSGIPIVEAEETVTFIENLAGKLGELEESYEITKSEYDSKGSTVKVLIGNFRYKSLSDYLNGKAEKEPYNAGGQPFADQLWKDMTDSTYDNCYYVQICIFSNMPAKVDIRIIDQERYRTWWTTPKEDKDFWFAKSIDLNYGEIKDAYGVTYESF